MFRVDAEYFADLSVSDQFEETTVPVTFRIDDDRYATVQGREAALRDADAALGVAIDRANQQWPDLGEPFDGSIVWWTPAGPATKLEAYGRDMMREGVTVLAAEMQRHGWSGELVLTPPLDPDLHRIPDGSVWLSAAVALSGWARVDGRVQPPWQFDDQVRERVVRWALHWVARGSDTVTLSREHGDSVVAPTREVPSLLSRPFRRRAWAPPSTARPGACHGTGSASCMRACSGPSRVGHGTSWWLRLSRTSTSPRALASPEVFQR